ncbi:MAG: ThiF family adenylyltransferase [Nanoarchaeota archaeon]
MIDYSRNWALNQEMIGKGSATIVGCGALANYICFYMAGLGLRNIRVIDDSIGYEREEFLLREKGKFKVLGMEDKIMAINDGMRIEAVPLQADGYLMGCPDVLLDLSNSPRTKDICLDHFYAAENIRLFVSASSSGTSSSAIFKRDKTKAARAMPRQCLEEFASLRQGGYPSGLMSAVILDEIRKVVSPLEGDSNYAGRINYGASLERRFSAKEIPLYSMVDNRKKVLICGAGGIGTYVALNLALEGVEIDVYDGDIIEGHNVARQLLYYGSIGEKKADVLESRLKHIVPEAKITARGSHITERTLRGLPEYDAIVCCADNWEARRLLNRHAMETSTMMINAAVTPFNAIAEAYIPLTNSCMGCRYDFDRLAGLRPQGCAEVSESNVVMTNAFIGALVAGEIVSRSTFLEKRFEYSSKSGNKRKFNILENKSRGETRCRCQER